MTHEDLTQDSVNLEKTKVLPIAEVRQAQSESVTTEKEVTQKRFSSAVAFLKLHKKHFILGFLAVIVLLVLFAGFILIRDALDPYDCRILNNVTIADVPVGGMTRAEAKAALRQATENTFSEKEMVVELPDGTLRLSPEDTKAKLDISAAVNAAYCYGRTGNKAQKQTDYEASFSTEHAIGLLPYLRVKEKPIRKALENYAQQYNLTYSELHYTMDGTVPPLAEESRDDSLPGQILKLTLGTPQLELDVDAVLQQILNTYDQNKFLLRIKEITPKQVPPAPDLQAIWEEFYIAPADATVSFETYQPVPGSYGYGFDLSAAQEMVNSAKWGQTLSIPMEYIEPEIMADEVFFRDVLGTCETKHTDDENRNTNLRLVCEILDGFVIQPGEEFSYNASVGERTAERGFKPAGAYSGTDLVQSIGGGVCQGSTTLYYCTLLADLEIVHRVNHGYAVSYIEKGLDATVSWHGPDFKFKNNTNFPIKIEAELSGGFMKMKLLGTDEKDYYVKMESEIVGYETGAMYVRSYKCKYDKETDELLSRDMEARSTYIYYGAY